MNEQRDDTELERYLDGESGESRAYAELGDEIPPPELDARILVEAERAVKVTEFDSRRAPPFKAFAWAAIVVLSFSLVLNIVFDSAVQDPVAGLDSMAKRSAAPSATMESKDFEEGVVTARKLERNRPESMMAQTDQPEAPVNQESARQDALLELRQQSKAMGRSADDAAEFFTVREHAVAVGRVAEAETDTPLTADLPSPASVDGDAQDSMARAMEIVADYLAEADGRSDAVASRAANVEEPRAELMRILDSYKAGDREGAAAALAEFRAMHPEHVLSLTLKERGL